MRAVLFDLGNTLVDDDGNLLEGAGAMLESVARLRDADGLPIELALVSDYYPAASPQELDAHRATYYGLLKRVGIASFFDPLARRVTLSTEVEVGKPDQRIFEAALAKLSGGLHLHHAVFITEDREHVAAARRLGMMAVHFKGPGQTGGEVERLVDLVPIVERLVKFSPCCKKRGEAVGRFASQANKNKRVDDAIQALVSQVREDRMRETIDGLAAFGTRWTFSNGIGRVPEWIHERFSALGYSGSAAPRFQPFALPGAVQEQRNVLCGAKPGEGGFVLVCAHYDSLSEDPSSRAPGADDNASGIAVLLEVARILKTANLRRGVCYAAFGGEEQGLFGSEACAEIAGRDQWPIDVVVNLDMIAFQDAAKRGHIVVEYDQGNRNPQNDAAAKAYGLMMAQAAADYTGLTVEHTDIWNSDYIPFEAKGYACIGVFEASENPGYHKVTDTLDRIELPHLAEVAKMVLATVAQMTR
jgi:FMN phosphatase YigB (HAD superfamily)